MVREACLELLSWIDYETTLKINERLRGIKKVEESTDF
jgi:hypothetical protein